MKIFLVFVIFLILSSFLIGVFPFFSFLSSLFSSLARNTDFFYKVQSHNIYDHPFFYFFFFIFFPTPLFRIPYIFSDFLNLMTKPFRPFYALSFCLKRVKVSYSLKNTQNSDIIINSLCSQLYIMCCQGFLSL